METPFNNNDILKIIISYFINDSRTLLKLSHVSTIFRSEIINNDIYPSMNNIIKNNNIVFLKVTEDNIININKEINQITNIIRNYLSNLQLLDVNNEDKLDEIKFIKNQILKYKQKILNLNNKNKNLNLTVKRLKKNNLFFNQIFTECKILQRPLNRNRFGGLRYQYTNIYVDQIKLKYIIENSNGNYNYIENLYYNKNTNMLHLTSCGTYAHCDPNNCIFIKKDN